MLYLPAILLIGAMSTSGKVFQTVNKYPSSDELETAPFEIKRFIPGYNAIYEERLYPSKKWVCTKPSETKEDVDEDCFFKLFYYIQGQNEGGVVINMTTPVIMPHDGEHMDEMCFFIGEQHQNAPPKPTGEGVYISQRREAEVYAVRFGGSSSDFNYMRHAKNLEKFLKNHGMAADFKMHIRAGYNSPWEFVRRNEIWYMKA